MEHNQNETQDNGKDLLTFKETAESAVTLDSENITEEPWKVLIVDDEPDVHRATKLVLEDLTVENRSIKFISAHSADEAAEILRTNTDIALVLLDVVMETDDAGLEVVRQASERLDNQTLRIVLRTGQPGQAPMREIIEQYDIDGYKTKSELTADKLFASVTTAIRAYRQLKILNASRDELQECVRGLEDRLGFQQSFILKQNGELKRLRQELAQGVEPYMLARLHEIAEEALGLSTRLVAGDVARSSDEYLERTKEIKAAAIEIVRAVSELKQSI